MKPYLTRALTVDLTTLESRNRGVTRMWKRESDAKATEGEKSALTTRWAWTTNVLLEKQKQNALLQIIYVLKTYFQSDFY